MSVSSMALKKRWILIKWFREWIYKLVSEQAAIEGQAALWVPTVGCDVCKWNIISGSRYCPYCGAPQEEEGPETETRFTVYVNKQSQPMRLNGLTPTQAYHRLSLKKRVGHQ